MTHETRWVAEGRSFCSPTYQKHPQPAGRGLDGESCTGDTRLNNMYFFNCTWFWLELFSTYFPLQTWSALGGTSRLLGRQYYSREMWRRRPRRHLHSKGQLSHLVLLWRQRRDGMEGWKVGRRSKPHRPRVNISLKNLNCFLSTFHSLSFSFSLSFC